MYKQLRGYLWHPLNPAMARELFESNIIEIYEVRPDSESLIEHRSDLERAIETGAIVGIECGHQNNIINL